MADISPIIGLGNVSSSFMFFSIFHQFYVVYLYVVLW